LQGTEAGPVEVIATRAGAELEEFEISEDGETAALLWNVAGRSELGFLDLSSGKTEAGPALPAEVAQDLALSSDGNLLAMTLTGPTAPPDIWMLERRSGRFRQVTHSPHAGVDLQKLVHPQLVRFRSHDGLELSGWLYRLPGSRRPGPLVLSFHGGPARQERPVFRPDYQALLARGISVFAPNIRGSSGFGKRFMNLDNGPLRLNAIRDIRACAEHVIQRGFAHPKRVGLIGHGYGGYLVMAGLAEYPDLFAAGAELDGVVDLEAFFTDTDPWMAASWKAEFGNPETQADMLRVLSPVHRLDRIQAPLLILRGANDARASVTEAEQVAARLKQRGAPVNYIVFPDEGHGLRKTANRIRATAAVVRWFDRYLK